MARSAGDETDFYQQTLDFLTPKIREAGQFWRVTYDLVCAIHLEEHNPRRQAEILPLYVELAALHIQKTNNNAYRDAIKLLKEANTLAKDALEQPLEADFLRLRTQHKAKRNFVNLFDQAFSQLSQG